MEAEEGNFGGKRDFGWEEGNVEGQRRARDCVVVSLVTRDKVSKYSVPK